MKHAGGSGDEEIFQGAKSRSVSWQTHRTQLKTFDSAGLQVMTAEIPMSQKQLHLSKLCVETMIGSLYAKFCVNSARAQY